MNFAATIALDTTQTIILNVFHQKPVAKFTFHFHGNNVARSQQLAAGKQAILDQAEIIYGEYMKKEITFEEHRNVQSHTELGQLALAIHECVKSGFGRDNFSLEDTLEHLWR